MNGSILANLLLELNVLNVADIDRELKQLTANIDDPRGQKWVLRVAKHFIINVDQLLAQPYRAKAEPRGVHSSKYHYRASGGFEPNQAPTEIPPEQKGKWWGEKPMAGDPGACPNCGGSGYLKKITMHGTGKPYKVPWTPRDPEGEKLTCPTCHGTGVNPLEGFQIGEARAIIAEVRKKRAAAAPEREVYEPDPPGVYTSRLHAPLAKRDIETNFTPYQTKKAPKKELFGGPPSAENAPEWVKNREGEQELHHFDPIQVRRRELWIRMENLVNYLNYRASMLALKDSQKPEEVARAKSAEAFFRQLETMHTGDIDGFRDVMRQAQDFAYEVENKPWLHMDDPKIIAEKNGITLLRASLPQTVQKMTCRNTRDGGEPSWCTDQATHAASYSKQGPLYFVDKDGYPYALIHFESGQAKSSTSGEPPISDAQAREIAPVFADSRRFPIAMFQQKKAYGNSELAILGKYVEEYRRKNHIL